MDNTIIILIAFLCIFTSIISALAGLSGGVVLLSSLTYFLPYQIVIPIHGIIQLISNASRSFYLRKNIKLSFLFFYFLGAPFGAYIAFKILGHTKSSSFPMILLSGLIFMTVFNPKPKYQLKIPTFAYMFVGLLTGMLSMFTGAVGPFLTLFFIRDDLDKEEIVATMASFQIITHFLKIPVFWSLNFAYHQYWNLFILWGCGSILGSYINSFVLNFYCSNKLISSQISLCCFDPFSII